MAVALYTDADFDGHITRQLIRRGVDILRAQDDTPEGTPDEMILERSSKLVRVLVTHDVRFHAMAEQWQMEMRRFAGLILAPQRPDRIGRYILDLEIIAKASEPGEWANQIARLPL